MITSLVVFAACAIALIVSGWSARRSDPDATVTELFDLMMTDRTVRLAIIVCWWWLGWHFLVGQTVDPGFGD
ncbi:DUF6186 family protein [Microbacterium immunditiarum]|uniref:Uncharacterized protein n=1 Tax=Microbacterium immunditiarum TaxID=337480 RepID=A0A7Y9GLC2_9MICO|nr:hypothetical protein [Microbacterium immunditiarum]